jgi:hypothetical protein
VKFRQYCSASMGSVACVPVTEADLLGKPYTGSSPMPPAQSSPEAGPAPTQGDLMPVGSGRPPDQMDDQLKEAHAMASTLPKALGTLPHPWNKKFHMFLRPLQGLVAKLHKTLRK